MFIVDSGADMISICIFLILLLMFFLLIKIASILKNLKIKCGSEKIIERHIIESDKTVNTPNNNSDNTNELESDKDKEKRIKDRVNMESRWEDKKHIESNMSNLGDENIVDGSNSMKAIELMRNMNKLKKKSSQ